mmetsp:Transcript_15091/g.19073  ORF Transcript_15091/g.19073 Transcript_15091/m.19073 type:complete len:83 (-) Transcript_15091:621-869(-)
MIIEERSQKSSVFSVKRDLCDVRVLRGPEPDYYVIALKLSSPRAAQAFISEFHNHRFNSLEAEVCQVFYMTSVTLFSDSGNV